MTPKKGESELTLPDPPEYFTNQHLAIDHIREEFALNHPSFVLLRGQRDIGKTALIRQLSRLLSAEGVQVAGIDARNNRLQGPKDLIKVLLQPLSSQPWKFLRKLVPVTRLNNPAIQGGVILGSRLSFQQGGSDDASILNLLDKIDLISGYTQEDLAAAFVQDLVLQHGCQRITLLVDHLEDLTDSICHFLSDSLYLELKKNRLAQFNILVAVSDTIDGGKHQAVSNTVNKLESRCSCELVLPSFDECATSEFISRFLLRPASSVMTRRFLVQTGGVPGVMDTKIRHMIEANPQLLMASDQLILRLEGGSRDE